jgi:tripartite-type tricarboxylate transporter receptor subunit TctC
MSEHAVNPRRRQALAALASMGGALLPLQTGWAQDAKSPLRLLVGYPAGGGGDALVRRISKSLGAVVPQAVVVDNKPGAGGTVAASALATSPPDGSVVYMADSAILVAPAVYEKLGYAVISDEFMDAGIPHRKMSRRLA